MPPLTPELPSEHRQALVVGTSRYADTTLSHLRAPARDANQLGAVLADPALGGFTVTKVLNRTAHNIRLTLEGFLRARVPADLVVVYLSCHGVQDDRSRLYFAATDTRMDRLAATGVESQWVIDLLDECRALSQVLILDCCFSGSFADGAKGATDLSLGKRFHGHGRGRAVLTASRAGEYSHEGKPIPGQVQSRSVFTSALVDGLTSGAADADQDGYVSVDEAFQYASDRMKKQGAAQTPLRWLYGAEDKILLARSPAGITVEPSTLPGDWGQALTSPHPPLRIDAVTMLGQWLTGTDPGRALAARTALEHVADTDIAQVAQAARALLDRAAPGTAPGAPADPASPAPVPSTPEPAAPTAPAATPPATPVKRAKTRAAPAKPRPAPGKPPPDPAPAPGPAAAPAGRRPWRMRPRLGTRRTSVARITAVTGLFLLVGVGSWFLAPAGLLGGGERPRSHSDQISALAFSPDGETLASGSHDRDVRLWNADTGKLRKSYPHKSSVTSVAYDRSGSRLAVGTMSVADRRGTVILRRAGSMEVERVLTGPKLWAAGLAFHPDGKTLAGGSWDRKVRLWDAGSGEPRETLSGHKDAVAATAFHPGGGILASASGDGTVRLWDPDDGKPLRTLAGHTEWVSDIAFDRTGQVLASVSHDGTARLWNPDTGELLRKLKGQRGELSSVAFRPAGGGLATGGQDDVRLWSPETGRLLRTFDHPGAVLALAFSPDGKTLATAGEDRRIRLWNPATGELRRAPL